MEIGINDFDEFDDVADEITPGGEVITATSNDDDIIDELLRGYGIADKDKILYENEYGEPEERRWNDLPREDKINILRNNEDPDVDLDDAEIQLINTIRSSRMSPIEYIQAIQKQAVSSYSAPEPQYQIDLYSDDELYVYDMLSKLGDDNVSDDEAIKELQKAKEDPELYQKKIRAIRNEYQLLEDANRQQQQLEEQEAAQQRYYQYTLKIAEEINNFNEFSGYDLNMDMDDKQEVYDFLTGYDAAGNNYFSKALQDPKLVTKMAWFLLKGEDMIRDVTNYFLKELSKRSNRNSDKSVYIPKNYNNNDETSFDDDFE